VPVDSEDAIGRLQKDGGALAAWMSQGACVGTATSAIGRGGVDIGVAQRAARRLD
jgi:hypothetical protein